MNSEESTLAAAVMEGLQEALGRLKGIHQRTAETLYAGSYDQGGVQIRALCGAWGEFLRVAHEVAPCLDSSRGEVFQKAVGLTLSSLEQVRTALIRKDWVETADLLSLEGKDLFASWSKALSEAAPLDRE